VLQNLARHGFFFREGGHREKITRLAALHPFYNCGYWIKGGNIVNNWRIIGLGGLVVLQALSGQTFAREQTLTVDTDAPAEESAEPDETGPAFTEDEQKRIQALRQWLLQRQLDRQRNEPAGIEALKEAAASDPRGLAHHLARGFSGGQRQENSVPRIGRGPDGRVHHRYVFNASGPDELQPASP
jgi:hypothetical protein